MRKYKLLAVEEFLFCLMTVIMIWIAQSPETPFTDVIVAVLIWGSAIAINYAICWWRLKSCIHRKETWIVDGPRVLLMIVIFSISIKLLYALLDHPFDYAEGFRIGSAYTLAFILVNINLILWIRHEGWINIYDVINYLIGDEDDEE